MNNTVLAPYPHHGKNHSVYDGGNYGSPNYQIKPNQTCFSKNHPPTPLVQPINFDSQIQNQAELL